MSTPSNSHVVRSTPLKGVAKNSAPVSRQRSNESPFGAAWPNTLLASAHSLKET